MIGSIELIESIETKPLKTSSNCANPRALPEAIAVPQTCPKGANFASGDRRFKILGLIIAAQIGALFAFAMPYAQTLACGDTVTLKCHTYDPRDIFKGDYVAITYDVGNKVSLKSFKPGETAYLTLKKTTPYWEAVSAHKVLPKSVGKDEATMKVIVNSGDISPPSISTGIERYYVAEGSARTINSDGLTAEVALSKEGMPVFKRLLSDGKEVGKVASK